MNEMKVGHTPGPWKLDRIVESDDRIHYAIQAPGRIGVMYYAEDAHLVAAAPELLEALKKLADDHEFGEVGEMRQEHLEEARAAIAKAEGSK